MKKLLSLIVLVGATLLLGGCFNSKSLDNIEIYTTEYPITFIAEQLYKDHASVKSIYPNDADTESYKLTKKQIKDYSKADLFIYNGLTTEKNLTKEFINKNDNLLIIDVSYGLTYENAVEELWLSPNNFLMLAKNIKENLIEYANNKYLEEEINTNYDELQEAISIMDADLRNIATTAKKEDKPTTLVVASNKFKYLENYGFTVISLEDEANLTENNLNAIKNNFKNGKYNKIIIGNKDKKTDVINDLVSDYKASLLTVDTMVTLSSENRDNNYDYYSLTKIFIDNIRNIIL